MKCVILIADALIRAALLLSGAADAESLDQGLIDRLEAAGHNPLRLNRDSRTKLLSGGLLTQYQVASLEDYRHSSGDILSLAELSLIDGFSREWAEAMAPFISLESSLLPGERDTLVWRNNILINTDLKAARGKYRLNVGDFTASVAGKMNYDGFRPGGGNFGSYTFNLDYCLPRWRFMAGDFNTRFGQGIAMWSGFRLSGLQTVDAFMLRPGGIVPSWSVTGDGVQRGLAAEWTPGNWRISAFGCLGGDFSLGGGGLGIHAERWFPKGECGVSSYVVPDGWKASIDGRWHIGRTTLFGEGAMRIVRQEEAAASTAWAGLIGCRISLGESDKLALQLRAFPSRFSGKKNGEYALAAGYAWRQASLTADFSLLPLPGKDSSRKQLKCYGLWDIALGGNWSLRLRAYERWRSYERNRLDLRGDLSWEKGFWTLRGRINGVFCRKAGVLGFLEGGFKNENWTIWLRGELFRIDSWDDRIYVYEHDAPGNFSVPACYGSGGTASLYGGWKKRLGRRGMTLRCYLRAYGMMRSGKDFSPALRAQTQLEF